MLTANLHPMVVHFPIALLLTGLMLAIISIFCRKCCRHKSDSTCLQSNSNATFVEKMSFWLLALGTLGAVAAVLSGFFFTPEMNSIFFATHHTFAISTMTIAVVATAIYAYWMFKARSNEAVRWIAICLYIAVGVLIAITGHYGGFLR